MHGWVTIFINPAELEDLLAWDIYALTPQTLGMMEQREDVITKDSRRKSAKNYVQIARFIWGLWIELASRRIHQILSQKLWVCFFGWELEGTGADAGNTTSAWHQYTNIRIILLS